MSNLLQAGGPASGLGELVPRGLAPIEYATMAVTVAVLLLGAYIGYQAYRGYRRNDDRAVLFLGVGIALVTTVQQAVSTLTVVFVTRNELVPLLAFFGISTAGLLSILYAFTRA
ncbi:hypothetical protein JCM18549_24380 [Halolamina salina]